MNPRIKRTQRDYTQGFKLSVVEQVEKGELTYKQAQARYRIQGRSTVLTWLRKHGRQDWRDGASSVAMSSPPKPPTPQQQIKALQVQLQEANEKAHLFEVMLDVLKQDYGVRVVKNLWASPHHLQGRPAPHGVRHGS